MELKIKQPTFPEVIEFNFDELRQEIEERSSLYKNIVYGDNQIKQAKTDVANLRKFTKALSDERIRVKKDILKPYEDFERKINELTGIVNASIKNIDGQIKGYEDQKKAEKLKKIKEYWESKEKPFVISLERIMDSKWMNASVSMKSVQAAIDSILEQVEKDLATLQNLPEFSFEAKEVYKSTLDLGKAIQEGHRLADIQRRKREHDEEIARKRAEIEAEQAARKQAEEAKKQEEIPCENTPEVLPTEPMKEWISFKALLTTEDALALKAFFESRNIEFEAI